MTLRATGALQRENLRSLFEKSAGATEKIGWEIENGIVDPETGRAAPYLGVNGVESLLRAIIADFGGTPVFGGDHVMGMRHGSGMHITLEHGGALEYASAPHDDLVTLVADMRTAMSRIAEIARGLGLAILPGANLPFNTIEDAQWVDKPRGVIMRKFFERLGDSGTGAPAVMALTLSTQVTLDYLSEDDLVEKLRMLVAASTVVAGMFVNSPFEGGQLTGLLSRRMHCWLMTDPRRCEVLPPALRDDMRIDDFIDWALRLPMIYYRAQDGTYRQAPERPFGSLINEGFEDGAMPTQDDWASHLSQIWTTVRLRETLELRAADGPAYADIPAVPALWVGLTYHPDSRTAAWELLRGHTLDEHRAALHDITTQGLAATLGDDSIRELGRELVRLAEAGLAARVRAGREDRRVLSYLDPIREVVESGRTFAERAIERWRQDLPDSPAHYIAAHRV
ncbi:MAG: glutamate-cysteine ligase family protein [Pseudonocardiaceae bacterium]